MQFYEESRIRLQQAANISLRQKCLVRETDSSPRNLQKLTKEETLKASESVRETSDSRLSRFKLVAFTAKSMPSCQASYDEPPKEDNRRSLNSPDMLSGKDTFCQSLQVVPTFAASHTCPCSEFGRCKWKEDH